MVPSDYIDSWLRGISIGIGIVTGTVVGLIIFWLVVQDWQMIPY